MTMLQLAEKVLELMNRYRDQFRPEPRHMGCDYEYGSLYLDVLGDIDGGPSWIDIFFNGKDIGRLEARNPNPYYPADTDAMYVEATKLYHEICKQCRDDREAYDQRKKKQTEDEFLSA